MRKIAASAIIGLLVLAFLLFYPFTITVAPDWSVRVVDEHGAPLGDVTVLEDWVQYSLESRSHEEEKITGADGVIHFPIRTMRASYAYRIGGCLSNFGQTGVHTSCGASAHVVAYRCGYGWLLGDIGNTKGDDWHGWSSHADAQIFLRYCGLGRSGVGCLEDVGPRYKPCPIGTQK
jgi:hypothetical protein